MARSELTPSALMQRLQHEQESRVDVVLNTARHTSLVLADENEVRLEVEAPELPEANGLSLPVTRWAHQQIAGRAQVPWKYYDRMLQQQPKLLMENVHTWWRNEPDDRLVRALLPNGSPGRVRAWLSDRFRIIDNRDFVVTVLEECDRLGGIQVHSSHVDDERLYLQLVSDNLEGEMRRGQPIRLGLTVRNSEVGDGAVVVQPWVLVLACTNGMVVQQNYARRHLGGNYDPGIVSGETVNLENAAIWSNVRDWVRYALAPENLNRVLAQLKRAEEVETPAKARPAVANVVRRMNLTTYEGQALLERYLLDAHTNGQTQYGMVQAVTQVAHEAPGNDYRRQVELEEVGGRLLDLGGSQYEAITGGAIDDETVATLLGS